VTNQKAPPDKAGLALVFPLAMLQQMLSGGAMVGGVSSAISRALGAGIRLLVIVVGGWWFAVYTHRLGTSSG
jgi:hypothetical protein